IAVEHEPRQQRCQKRARERDLIHRAQVRPDQLVVPAADLRLRESLRHALAPPRGALARGRRVVIDGGVIVRDGGGARRWCRGSWREGLAHRMLLFRRRDKGRSGSSSSGITRVALASIQQHSQSTSSLATSALFMKEGGRSSSLTSITGLNTLKWWRL